MDLRALPHETPNSGSGAGAEKALGIPDNVAAIDQFPVGFCVIDIDGRFPEALGVPICEHEVADLLVPVMAVSQVIGVAVGVTPTARVATVLSQEDESAGILNVGEA